MSRPIINDEFRDFFDWMRSSGRCTPGVAKAYASYMRRLSRDIDGQFEDAERVKIYFAEAYASDHGYAKLRAAWAVFVEWYASTKDQNLPMPDSANVIRSKNTNATRQAVQLPGLSDSLRRALRVLRANGITMNAVAKLRWADVDLQDMKGKLVTHIRVPNKNTHWVVPTPTMLELYDHAKVGLHLYKPLLPREPGSEVPYPYPALLREVEILTEEEVQAVDRPTDTSALGAALLKKQYASMPKPQEWKPTMTTKELLRILDEPARPIPTKYDPAHHAVFRQYEDRFKNTPQPYDHLLQQYRQEDDDDEEELGVNGPGPTTPVAQPSRPPVAQPTVVRSAVAQPTVPRPTVPRPTTPVPVSRPAAKSKVSEPSWLALCGLEDEDEEEGESESDPVSTVDDEDYDEEYESEVAGQDLASIMAYDPNSND